MSFQSFANWILLCHATGKSPKTIQDYKKKQSSRQSSSFSKEFAVVDFEVQVL